MNSPMEVLQSFLQVVSIFLPRHPVHSRRCPPFQVVVAAAKQVDVNVVQQGGEPHLRVSLGCLSYTVQPAWPALPARCPVRIRLFRVLLGQRPSLHDLLRPSLACVRPLRCCRVGGGALARWPPSAAQTVRTVFPHTAFTKTHASEMQSKGSTESSSPARTRHTAWFPATVASHRSATA